MRSFGCNRCRRHLTSLGAQQRAITTENAITGKKFGTGSIVKAWPRDRNPEPVLVDRAKRGGTTIQLADVSVQPSPKDLLKWPALPTRRPEGSQLWPRSHWPVQATKLVFDPQLKTKKAWIDQRLAYCHLCQEPVGNMGTHCGWWDHNNLHLFFRLWTIYPRRYKSPKEVLQRCKAHYPQLFKECDTEDLMVRHQNEKVSSREFLDLCYTGQDGQVASMAAAKRKERDAARRAAWNVEGKEDPHSDGSVMRIGFSKMLSANGISAPAAIADAADGQEWKRPEGFPKAVLNNTSLECVSSRSQLVAKLIEEQKKHHQQKLQPPLSLRKVVSFERDDIRRRAELTAMIRGLCLPPHESLTMSLSGKFVGQTGQGEKMFRATLSKLATIHLPPMSPEMHTRMQQKCWGRQNLNEAYEFLGIGKIQQEVFGVPPKVGKNPRGEVIRNLFFELHLLQTDTSRATELQRMMAELTLQRFAFELIYNRSMGYMQAAQQKVAFFGYPEPDVLEGSGFNFA